MEGTSGAAERSPLRGGGREAALREALAQAMRARGPRGSAGLAGSKARRRPLQPAPPRAPRHEVSGSIGLGRSFAVGNHGGRRRLGEETCPQRNELAPDPRVPGFARAGGSPSEASVPGGPSRGASRAMPLKCASGRCIVGRDARGPPRGSLGFVTSAVVLAGRVGCRDRRAARGRQRPEVKSLRKRFGLAPPPRRGERAPKTGPGRPSPGIGSRSPVTSGVRARSRRLSSREGVLVRGSPVLLTERRREADLASIRRAALRRVPRAEVARLDRRDKDVRGRSTIPVRGRKRRGGGAPSGRLARSQSHQERSVLVVRVDARTRSRSARSWPRTPSRCRSPATLAGVRSIGLVGRRRSRPAAPHAGVSRSDGYTEDRNDRRGR
jgi:hypothetical protein